MIKIRIKNADHEIDIRFPISESELFAKLGEIHAVEGRDAAQSAYVTDIYWPEEFSVLKGHFVNLDEMNYLGKRMESFDTLEYDQFLIGISKLDSKEVKDLINLTFNLNHFTLCQDVSNYGKIGREYVLNTEGAVPAHDEDDPKYAAIGKELIDKGLAQITERGLLIYNPFDELEEVYDGHTVPEYYYNNSLLSLNAEYGGRTELLQLPDESLAIKKAMDRLGAPSPDACSYTATFHNFKGDGWLDRVQEIIAREGIFEANAMLKALDSKEMDWNKLSAVFMNMASSLSVASDMKRGRNRCGASGIAPLSTANRQYRIAFPVFLASSPANGDATYTSGFHTRASFSIWESASCGTGS